MKGLAVAGAVRSFGVSATNGSGTLVYGVGQLVGQITCVNISGNTAVVGGTIVSAANASYVGDPMDMYFVDNGPPSGSSVGGDQVSPIEIGAPGTFGGLPKTCPAAMLPRRWTRLTRETSSSMPKGRSRWTASGPHGGARTRPHSLSGHLA